ncbi:MAG: 6-phosphogluconolactonase [Acidobacteria bacterium]|nr:6-phosphogluconolactonase [Acidobacteriota bacterium]
MNGEVVAVDDVAAAFADLVVREAPRTVALSGGATARRCYETLATRGAIDWPSIAVVFGDERWVPVDHPDSNEGMARAELLDHVPVGVVHSMRDAGEAIDAAAAAYDQLVAGLDGIDLVHLGLGPDGHTASLFPGSAALDVDGRLVVPNEARLAPFHPRLTFTLPAIARGRHVVFTVDGAEKTDVFRRVMAGDDLPATRVRAERITWLVARALVP